MCHKRCVPALDSYWDTLQSIILPRFEYVFRLNINSIRDCDPTKFNREMGPHYVSNCHVNMAAGRQTNCLPSGHCENFTVLSNCR